MHNSIWDLVADRLWEWSENEHQLLPVAHNATTAPRVAAKMFKAIPFKGKFLVNVYHLSADPNDTDISKAERLATDGVDSILRRLAPRFIREEHLLRPDYRILFDITRAAECCGRKSPGEWPDSRKHGTVAVKVLSFLKNTNEKQQYTKRRLLSPSKVVEWVNNIKLGECSTGDDHSTASMLQALYQLKE